MRRPRRSGRPARAAGPARRRAATAAPARRRRHRSSAISRASRSSMPMSTVISSPARPPSVRGPTTVARRRSAVARPSATHTLACAGVGPLADRPVDDLAQVDPVGPLHRAGRADGRDVGADAGQPESSGGVAVAVVADEVPAAAVGDHTPRLDGAGGVRLAARRAGAGTARPARNRWRTTGFPSTSSEPRRPGSTAVEVIATPASARVDVDAGRPQLEQCALGGGDELRRFPQLGRHGDGGGLVGGQLDGGQGVGLAVDAVALGRVELRHPAGLQRDAQVAQLVLVALEHARERLVAGAVGVAVDGFADPLGGDEGAGGQQRDDEIHQPLDFGDPHS